MVVRVLALFFLRESTNPNRFFPVGLFKSPIFMAAICAGFVYNFGTAVGFLQLTNLWQFINGLTTLEVSLWQLPFLPPTPLLNIWRCWGRRPGSRPWTTVTWSQNLAGSAR